MIVTFTVEAEINHVSGKFVPKDDITQEIIDSLDSADPGTLQIDESEYEVSGWIVGIDESEAWEKQVKTLQAKLKQAEDRLYAAAAKA